MRETRPRQLRLAATLAVTLAATTVPLLGTSPASGSPAGAAAPDPTVELSAPTRQVVYGDAKRVYTDLGIRLEANGAPLVIRARRVSYSKPLVVTATLGDRTTTLPAWAMKDFSGFDKLLRLSAQRLTRTNKPVGKPVTFRRDVCLGTMSDRVSPEAPATSPYPTSCYYNPYSLGGVQGIEAGWAASMIDPYGTLRLTPGRYDVTVSLRPAVARALGVAADGTTARTRVFVRKYTEEGEGHHGRAARDPRPRSDAESRTPNAQAPSGPSAAPEADGPRPDLRSLPAWGIQVSRNSKYLQFSATVWNAGDSPLVVDGFRRRGQDVMDAYQYFFDSDGNQTGYEPVGSFEWDPKPTHLHWHFKDFATYTLLRADKTRVVKSRKEAFCLANTDAVDFTVPGARWNIETDDLTTACGEYSSRSIREVLASGWGDTYAQFRAGQSFKISNLPNGVYYIEVAGNPTGNLVESDESNNVALRKIWLRGPKDHRKVRVQQVGIIEEQGSDDGGPTPSH